MADITDEELVARHLAKERMAHNIFDILERCDLLAISDGSKDTFEMAGKEYTTKAHRYAVAFAARDGSVMDYVQGDDLPALLEEVLKRVS